MRSHHEVHGTGRPLVLLHGGLLTIDLSFGAMIPTLASHRVIAVELHAAEMHELFPHAQPAVVPGTTHVGLMQRTDIFAPMIEAFLPRTSG